MKRTGLILLLLICYQLLYSLDYISVPLDHPVYELLEQCELKGILPSMGDVKPYREKQVRQALEYLSGKEDQLSLAERTILNRYIDEFDNGGSLPLGLYGNVETEDKADLNSGAFHSYNRFTMGMKNDFNESISYNVNINVLIDKIDPDAFEPYSFTKRYDGFHIWFGDDKYSSNTYAQGIAFSSLPELGISLLDDRLYLGLNRIRRNWGEGISSLLLAGTGRPIFGFEYSWQIHPSITLSGMVGSLGNANGTGDNFANYKNITTHYLEFNAGPYFDLVLFDTAIWGKRNEIGYFFLLPTFITQQIGGDVDNIAQGGTITAKWPGVGKAYFTLFIDEMENDEWANFFHHNKNMYAWNTGFKTIVPGLPFGMFTFQYTKIEPFTYAHYAQTYPNYTDPININFTNDGENIAYNLPPNSDQFLAVLTTKPVTGMTVRLKYSLIRHGDNPGDLPYNGGGRPVRGDINEPLDFADHFAGLYDNKDFLHDGIYEFIHTFTAETAYSLPAQLFPLDLKLAYSFVTAENYGNIQGNSIMKNIISLNVQTSF